MPRRGSRVRISSSAYLVLPLLISSVGRSEQGSALVMSSFVGGITHIPSTFCSWADASSATTTRRLMPWPCRSPASTTPRARPYRSRAARPITTRHPLPCHSLTTSLLPWRIHPAAPARVPCPAQRLFQARRGSAAMSVVHLLRHSQELSIPVMTVADLWELRPNFSGKSRCS